MTDADAEADAADMAALRRGDEQALNRLMNRWQVPLRAFLYRQIHDESAALDLAQETFVRVYRHADRFRSGARFSTWLFAIAVNLARDHARRTRRRPTTSLDEAPELADSQTPKAVAETDERAQAVRDAIANLPEDLREAVVLFEYEDRSHAEIGKIVGATPKAVETRLYRARQTLKKSLARYLG